MFAYDVVGQKCTESLRSTVYVLIHICASVVVVFVASSGQELRALWADKVDALGQRRHDAVGLGMGAGNAVSFTTLVYSNNHTRYMVVIAQTVAGSNHPVTKEIDPPVRLFQVQALKTLMHVHGFRLL